MPIIIDANRAGDFSNPLQGHAQEIISRINSKQMSIALGGKLTKELSKTKLKDLLLEWVRAGRAKRIDDRELTAEEARLETLDLVSNDSHVLALAIKTNCKLLYSADDKLIIDFKNVKIISPKGKVVKPTTKKNIALAMFNNHGL